MENEDKASKSQIAMSRCAKAALLLCRLKSLQRTTTEEMDNPIAERAFKEKQDQALRLTGAICSAPVAALCLDLLLRALRQSFCCV